MKSYTKKYVIVGCGNRGIEMFAVPIVKKFSDVAELVGISDVNLQRMGVLKKRVKRDIASFKNFSEMLKVTKPDTVIVTTIDKFHHKYIIEALEFGADVITEKPMTIDDEKCRAILNAQKRTGKKVTVTFNYRFTPYVSKIKELISKGAIGKILSVDFEWILDARHGADYFRRWHRNKANSGGLLVHKATHHFDLVNWLINQEPETVFAFGGLNFYGPKRKQRGQRCLTCKYKSSCEFYMDISCKEFKKLYLEAEKCDGYYRDKCVFAVEIDIEDTMALCVKYDKGAVMTYSLIAHSPYEGWRMAINGTNGRLEAEIFESGHKASGKNQKIMFYDRKGQIKEIIVPKSKGGHGGGDERLLRMLFVGDLKDPLGHMAGTRAGAMSILTGISANYSIALGKPINVKDLLKKSPVK